MTKFRYHIMLATVLLAAALTAAGQDLPIDPDVRYGQLPNGLTYYVRHNAVPAGFADVHLIYKVGSTVERDDERGFAHLLEHISFEGTTHYPENEITEFIEDHGAVFGSDINANTGYDFTVYKFSNIRLANAATVDTVLLMMRDMACELAIDSAGLAKQRDIVIEEWRSETNLNQRIVNSIAAQLMPGCPYSTRIPIGDMDIIGNVTRDKLNDFYRRWYRPELMAVVAVGDFDTDSVAASVARVMGTLTNPDNAPRRTWATVPANDGLLLAAMTDDEVTIPQMRLAFKYDDMPMRQRNTREYADLIVSRTLLVNLLNLRLQELMIDPMSSVGAAEADDGEMFGGNVSTKRELSVSFSPRDGNVPACVTQVMAAIAAARQHGFTQGEADVVKRRMTTFYDNAMADLGKHDNATYVDEYTRHFQQGGYIPGISAERDLCVALINTMPVAHIDSLLRQIVTPDDAYLVFVGNNDSDTPDPTAADKAWRNALANNYPVPVDDVDYTAPLLAHRPKPGTVLQRVDDNISGTTTLHMSNGATVVLKPTDFKNDEVLFAARARGGTLCVDKSLTATAKCLNLYTGTMRIGGWSPLQLIKRMAADYCNLEFDVDDDHHGFEGNCNTAGLTTIMQLCHLCFTDVEPDRDAFAAVRQTAANVTRNALNDTDTALTLAMLFNITSDNYCVPPPAGAIESISIDDADALYRDFTGNAAEYTFTIVGNFDSDEAEELACRYIGSLPGQPFMPRSLRHPALNDTCVVQAISMKHPSPRCPVVEFMAGDIVYTHRNELMMKFYDMLAGGLLNYFMREYEHLTYGIHVESSVEKPTSKWVTIFKYDVSIDNLERAVNIIDSVLHALRTGAMVMPDYFDAVKKQMQQQHELELRTNAYWREVLSCRAEGIDAVTGVDDFYRTVTLNEFNEFVAKMNETTIVSVYATN